MVSVVPPETFFIWVVHWDESKVSFGGSSAQHLGTEGLSTVMLKSCEASSHRGVMESGLPPRTRAGGRSCAARFCVQGPHCKRLCCVMAGFSFVVLTAL